MTTPKKESTQLAHSPLGKAAVIMAIVTPTLALLLNYVGLASKNELLINLCLFFVYIISPLMWIAGLTLSIIGLTKKLYMKTLPIIGLILHILAPCCVIAASIAIYGLA